MLVQNPIMWIDAYISVVAGGLLILDFSFSKWLHFLWFVLNLDLIWG